MHLYNHNQFRWKLSGENDSYISFQSIYVIYKYPEKQLFTPRLFEKNVLMQVTQSLHKLT